MEHIDYPSLKFMGYGIWLGITISILDIGEDIHILNVYVPYQNRIHLWDTLFNKSFLKYHLVILGGDLNFSLGLYEFLGMHERDNPLAGYLISNPPCSEKPGETIGWGRTE